MAVEIDELLTTIDEAIAHVHGIIEGHEALMVVAWGDDKDDVKNFLSALQEVLSRFTGYRHYLIQNVIPRKRDSRTGKD